MNLVFDRNKKVISNSHNLRGILEHARIQRGVAAITVYAIRGEPGRPEAFVHIQYNSGAVGQTFFSDADHALKWAVQQSKLPARRSWWHGCGVYSSTIFAGRFDWNNCFTGQEPVLLPLPAFDPSFAA